MQANETTYSTLRRLAAEEGESMTAFVERAVERYRRKRPLEAANAAWEKIICDPTAREEIEREDALIDGMLADGLAADEWWQ